MIFGQYLTIRPLSPSFTTTHYVVESQVVWVRLPGLSEGYYPSSILKAIGQAIGPVIKLVDNTKNARRGRFARMAICVNLQKHLLSKIKISE